MPNKARLIIMAGTTIKMEIEEGACFIALYISSELARFIRKFFIGFD